MAADRLDLVFFLGDYIYESAGSPTALRPVPGAECQTLDDYRLRYATYTSDADLQASRAACPWVVTWDDHEVENNYADDANTGGLDAAAFSARRAAAYQAFYEHTPVRLDPPTDADYRIYRSVRVGQLAEFFVLDGRQYRTDQACNSANDAIVPRSSCDGIDDEARTMLGTEQESWLSDGLAGSDATWKVLAQQTVMSSLVLGDIVLNVDQWDGYPAARRRLLEFISDKGISDVVVLTGDIHSAGAGDLGLVAADGTRTPVAVEFVGTSITSGSLVDRVPGGAAIVTPDKFPGIAYLNVRDHGYGRCTITPTEWRTEFVVVESIADAAAPARVDATCVTTQGVPSVTLV
jgi:alkaline phosphatase D